MVRLLCAAVVVASACGRVGFAPLHDAPPQSDAPMAPIPGGAVLYLPFTNAPVGTIVEDVAAGHSVACSPACPTVGAGARGPGYFFDPLGPDILVAQYAADLDCSNGFTVALWIRLADVPPPPYYCAFMKPVGAGTNNSWGLCVGNDLRILYHSGNAAGTDNLMGPAIGVGEWHHLAMTWDQTTKRGYLDGAPQDMRAVPVGNDSNPIIVGADLNSGAPAYPLHGELDELLVYGRVLTGAEIAELAAR